MVLAEEGERKCSTAREMEVVRVSEGKTAEIPSSSREVEKKEREIVRLTMIAEKDKRDSIALMESIKKLKEQLQYILDDFYQNPKSRDELLRKCNMTQRPDGELVFCQTIPERHTLPSSPVPTRNTPPPSSSFPREDIENTPPNSFHNVKIPTNSPKVEHYDSKNQLSEFETLNNLLKSKDEELKRVQRRASEEAARAASLRSREEELKQVLSDEFAKWHRYADELRQEISRKEKEVVRLSILAEQDKKASMFMRDQITKLKKSLESFITARADNKSQVLQQLLLRCDPQTPPLISPPNSAPNTPQPSPFGEIRGEAACTDLRRDIDELLRIDVRKESELSRVRSIADTECRRAAAFKEKVEELKEALVAEMQFADEELSRKIQDIRRKQMAIQKVAARAERERARSYFLREEIIKLSKALYEEQKNVPPMNINMRDLRRNDFAPDMAYLQDFSELGDLREFAAGADLSSAPPLTPREPQVDPINFVHSPPCRCIPIGASENIYVQKIRDLEVLEREKTRKEEELTRLKRVAEAERCRHLLLKDKMQELQGEVIAYERMLQRGEGVSRTF
jgi:hypothetical protein